MSDWTATFAEKGVDYTVLRSDTGTIFLAKPIPVPPSTGIDFTLPPTAKGLTYTFIAAPSQEVPSLVISPVAADNINGGTDDKHLINSGDVGDSCTIVGDGTNGWHTTKQIGTWTAEA